jgi:hypothetical protein
MANIIDEMDMMDFNTGQKPGMTPLECLRLYPSARAKLIEMVPELVEDIRAKILDELGILHGKEAEHFAENARTAASRPVSREEYERARKAYEEIKKNKCDF